MRFFLTVVALAAVAYAAPTTTHTMEVGANGVSGSLLNTPLVEIVVNMIKDVAEAVVPETVNEPVVVVDEPQSPEAANPVDVIAVNPVLPEPTPAEVVPAPTPAEVVPAPIVLPEPTPAEIVPTPIVLPEPAQPEVIPEPVVLPELTPTEVVPSPVVVPEPTPAEVIAVPEPVQVVEVALESPEVAADASASGSQIINVIMNFVFGESGALSSIEVPANVISQIVGAPRV